MDDATLTVTLELRLAGDALSGRATGADGASGRVRRLARTAGGARRVRPRHVRRDLREGLMSTIEKPHVSLGTLRRHLRGVPVIGPGEEGWDAARQAFNTTVDQRPALIATPLDADDVAAVVRYAADAGLQVAPQRTGHNAGAARRPRRQHPAEDRPAPGRQDRRREPHAPASAPARSGRRSSRAPPTSASPRCTARRRTSASPATRSAAASAGTAASTASPRTASPRSSS